MLAQAFQHESLIWRGLDHPHVLEFLGVDDNVFRHHLCMVLPWMELGNIRNAATHLRETASQTEMNKQILIWVCVVSNICFIGLPPYSSARYTKLPRDWHTCIQKESFMAICVE